MTSQAERDELLRQRNQWPVGSTDWLALNERLMAGEDKVTLLAVAKRLSRAISNNWLTINPQGSDATVQLLREFRAAIAREKEPA